MQSERNYVISIAGFDPSGGAGILADIKTFEQLEVYGLGVCSAITVQTEEIFVGVEWMSLETILQQLKTLLQKYPVSFLKIGLIQDMSVLEKVLIFLKNYQPGIGVIWDPVLSASAGFVFHDEINEHELNSVAEKVLLITPNTVEVVKLMKTSDALIAAKRISAVTNVFLKSYEDEGGDMMDVLFDHGEVKQYHTMADGTEKHGSGCVLSAAITSFLAKGYSLEQACAKAKAYTLEFRKSSAGLLGYHNQNTIAHHA